MIDLKGNPFYLSEEAAAWVYATLDALTVEEKIGQLFCPISFSGDEDYLRAEILRFHVGGLMFKTSPPAEVRGAYDFMQRNSKVPVLCAANLEFGSTGFLEGGTPSRWALVPRATNVMPIAWGKWFAMKRRP